MPGGLSESPESIALVDWKQRYVTAEVWTTMDTTGKMDENGDLSHKTLGKQWFTLPYGSKHCLRRYLTPSIIPLGHFLRRYGWIHRDYIFIVCDFLGFVAVVSWPRASRAFLNDKDSPWPNDQSWAMGKHKARPFHIGSGNIDIHRYAHRYT